eukprot:TRINITY_DN66249_c4_g5_i1.p1 TRINITY_DN66249_c4_g5~~TRINITY_DN66249_c4_g5_i1.p1  ORF type:complete len:189 (-),score=4.34 TRINITY_DN66249_c4_g5_i1:118-654(-)
MSGVSYYLLENNMKPTNSASSLSWRCSFYPPAATEEEREYEESPLSDEEDEIMLREMVVPFSSETARNQELRNMRRSMRRTKRLQEARGLMEYDDSCFLDNPCELEQEFLTKQAMVQQLLPEGSEQRDNIIKALERFYDPVTYQEELVDFAEMERQKYLNIEREQSGEGKMPEVELYF